MTYERARVGSWKIVWHLLTQLSAEMGCTPTNQWLRSRYMQRKKPITGSKQLWFLYKCWMISAVLLSHFLSHSLFLPSFSELMLDMKIYIIFWNDSTMFYFFYSFNKMSGISFYIVYYRARLLLLLKAEQYSLYECTIL